MYAVRVNAPAFEDGLLGLVPVRLLERSEAHGPVRQRDPPVPAFEPCLVGCRGAGITTRGEKHTEQQEYSHGHRTITSSVTAFNGMDNQMTTIKMP